jgi:hypothetical protein
MQHCNQDASITVTLCSGEAYDNSTSGGEVSAPAYDVQARTNDVPTTLATVTTAAAANDNVVYITKTIMAYETDAVSQDSDGVVHVNAKRHQHHPHGHHQ